MENIILAIFAGLGVLFVLMFLNKGNTDYSKVLDSISSLKGNMESLDAQVKQIRQTQEETKSDITSIDAKSANLIKDVRERVTAIENKKPVPLPVTIVDPVKMKMVYYKVKEVEPKKKIVPNAPGPLLKRAQELSQ